MLERELLITLRWELREITPGYPDFDNFIELGILVAGMFWWIPLIIYESALTPFWELVFILMGTLGLPIVVLLAAGLFYFLYLFLCPLFRLLCRHIVGLGILVVNLARKMFLVFRSLSGNGRKISYQGILIASCNALTPSVDNLRLAWGCHAFIFWFAFFWLQLQCRKWEWFCSLPKGAQAGVLTGAALLLGVAVTLLLLFCWFLTLEELECLIKKEAVRRFLRTKEGVRNEALFCILEIRNPLLRRELVGKLPLEDLHPTLCPLLLLREQNAEVRREIIRKIGLERALASLGKRTVDRWQDYELLEVEFPNPTGRATRAHYLKMKNPSSGEWHVEGVPPNVGTCREALSWRVEGLEWNPEEIT